MRCFNEMAARENDCVSNHWRTLDSYTIIDIDNDGVDDLISVATTASGPTVQIIHGLTDADEGPLPICVRPDGKIGCTYVRIFPSVSIHGQKNDVFVLSGVVGLGHFTPFNC